MAPSAEFPRNQWYVAAYGTEITSQDLFPRTICGAPIVFYRDASGTVVALADRCVHRRFPLSQSNRVGDTIVCGYHGFTYDTSGTCVAVPGQTRIPRTARVKAYPVVEQDSFVWIWIGDGDPASTATIPRAPWLASPDWTAVSGLEPLAARHALLVDNLMDLSHETYLHGGYIGTPEVASAMRLRLAGKSFPARDVVALALEPASGGELPAWTPGAHIDLHLPGGLIRQYSLCGDPADRTSWRVAVLREPEGRGGSARVHDELAPGHVLDAVGPRNNFPLADAERYLFIAGGVGITPILPMLAEATGRGRPWRLAYGGRTRASMAFLPELARWPNQVTIWPQDEHGLLDLEALLAVPQPGTAVYCCGPEPLLRAVEDRCARWPAGALHVERLTPMAVTSAPDRPFEVELASCSRVIGVPAGVSVLSALRGAGVEVLSSCEEGTCGTCETGVLDGLPDHRDSVLTGAERDATDIMMICVSRARTPRLVLDL